MDKYFKFDNGNSSPPARGGVPSEGGSASGGRGGGSVFSPTPYPLPPTPCARRGQMIIEILVAIAILTIATVAATMVILGGQKMSIDSRSASEALSLARKSLEQAQAMARDSYASVTASTSTQGIYTTTISTTDMSATRKDVTARTTWQVDASRTQSVQVVTTIMDISGVQNLGGDTGGTGTTGDWKNPETLGSVDLDSGEQATGLDVVNKIVYMSATASSASKPDFFIVDATDPTEPEVIASLNTGPGLNAVDMAGGYAYVANNSNTQQFQVINVANIHAPALVATFQLPGVSGSGGVGNAIFYYNKRIYIGTKRATGSEFHIVDVTNPLGPIEMGSYEVGADVNSIYVVGSKAYLATADDSKEVMVLDVSNPSTTHELGFFNATAGDDGQSVYLVGSTLYLGRASGSNDLVIADASNPASFVQKSSTNVNGTSINGITVRGNLMFLATSQSNAEFQAWDISDPMSPTLWSSFNFSQIGTSIDYEDNLVYMAVRSNDALRIITSQ